MPRFNFWEFIGIEKPGAAKQEAQAKGGENDMLRTRRAASLNATQQRLQEMHDTIAKKAYEFYEKRNCQSGYDQQDWLEAERLVRRNMRQRQ